MKNFVHLHTHSHYSLLDAAVSVKSLVTRAKEYNMPALAITDHGNLFGAIEFYNTAKKIGIKPIIGCELYVAIGPHTEKKKVQGQKNNHHLVVLAQDSDGYRNLLKLASIAYTEGFYYRPRVDKDTIRKYSKGLMALTACLGGEVPNSILKGDMDQAKNAILEYQDIFGKDNFYLELQRHGIKEQEIANQKIIELSKEFDAAIVATNDVHYLQKDHAEAHDILLCIGSQNKVTDEKRKRYPAEEFYFKSYEEMSDIFSDYPEAIENTLKIAEKCNLELEFKASLPKVDVPNEQSEEDYLRELCEQGLNEKYPEITDVLTERLEYELGVINKMGFAAYFLIVWDFINYAKNNGIAVGPGRGSAAGSLVAYTLGITDLDPLRYNLIFERFLNPDRISMPDIDTDFEDAKRDQVIKYVIEKYGKDRVASIITFGALKARAVIRDVGRVLDVPLNEVDKIAKLIPGGPGASLDKAYNDIPDLKAIIDSHPRYKKLFEISRILEGINRHAGTHAAGIVIGHEDLSNIVPLYADTKTGNISTQYDGGFLEEVGLLKMDFLGLKNLTVIQKALEQIKLNKNIELDLKTLPLDDPKVFELLKKGESLGVFQLESSGMQELMRNLKPEVFEDIIALIALYRPGPLNSGMAEEFIQRKNNPHKIKFDHPLLEDILKETYGVIVYQEQVMAIAKVIGGFTMAKADELRKAMGKKLADKMEALKELFMKGAEEQEIDLRFAERLYGQMAKFGEYGFNKSHSAAYALITYQTAYLKSNFPIEYMTALLSCDRDNTDKVVEYIQESKKMGIKVLPPNVNNSLVDFSIEDQQIRFGLTALKNVGLNAVQSIIDSRSEEGIFENIYNLCERVDLRLVNKKVLECLIKSGACDDFQANRASLFNSIDKALDYGQKAKEEKNSGQFSLFGEEQAQEINISFDVEIVEEWSQKEKLVFEKEILGFYLSGHPLEKYNEKIQALNLDELEFLSDYEEGQEVAFCGLVQDMIFRVSKKGTEWAAVQLSGITGSCEVLLFNKNFQNAKPLLQKDAVFYVKGRLESLEPKLKVISDIVLPIDDVNEANLPKVRKARPKKILEIIKKVHIRIKEEALEQSEQIDLNQLKSFFLNHKGQSPIFLHFPAESTVTGEVTIKAGDEFNINVNEDLLSEMSQFSCVDHVWLN